MTEIELLIRWNNTIIDGLVNELRITGNWGKNRVLMEHVVDTKKRNIKLIKQLKKGSVTC